MLNQNRIPHIYHNTVYAKKIFEIIYSKHLEMRKISDLVENFNDLDKCFGYALDIHGQNYSILRNGRNDEDYKKVLKFEMANIKSMGSPENIKKLLALYFNLTEDGINLGEGSGKIYLRVPKGTDLDAVRERLEKIKGAGIGYIVDYEIYIEDYRLTELATMKLSEIAKIKLARK